MKLEVVAAIFSGGLLLLASSCSGNSESADFTGVGGTDSGGSGSAQAGKNQSGGSSAGGGAGSGGAAQAGSGAGAMATNASCEGFAEPALDKSCTTDDDCFAGVHTLDCCGSQVVLGYSVLQQSSFNGYEMECMTRAVCRCAPQDPTIEGGQVTSDIELRRAVCSAGHCLGTGPVYVGN